MDESYHFALRCLSKREYSAQELRQKLARKNILATTIDEIIQKLQQEDLQSDARYTQNLIRRKMAAGFGPLRIQHILHQKGIEKDCINKYLHHSEEVWLSVFVAIWEKKFSHKAVLDPPAFRFFLQRGFPAEWVTQFMGFLYDER